MKGLLVKDLLVLRKYARTMVVFILVYIVVFSMLDSVDVISGMVTLVLAMMSVATFSYDELAKWDRFGLTMPVSRNQVVASRYLVCLLFTLIGGVVTLAFRLGVAFLWVFPPSTTPGCRKGRNVSLVQILPPGTPFPEPESRETSTPHPQSPHL